MPTDHDPCREAFEAFMVAHRKTQACDVPHIFKVLPNGRYARAWLESLWIQWQAAVAWVRDHDAAEHAASISRILDERK